MNLQFLLVGKDNDMFVFSLSVGIRAVDGSCTRPNVNERVCKCELAAESWGMGRRSGGESRTEGNRADESHCAKRSAGKRLGPSLSRVLAAFE